MGKQLRHQDTSVGGNRPGCMWSLMSILDYHHWSNVKKILPQRKRAGGKRVRRKLSQTLSHILLCSCVMFSDKSSVICSSYEMKIFYYSELFTKVGSA
ncbi:hypothetical protein ACFX2B_029188 [Malus domestica]